MRDINRIEPFLQKFKELWERSPDLRFGQLVYNLAQEMECIDIFFPEEDEWEIAIQAKIDRNKGFVSKRKEEYIKGKEK